MIIIGLPGFGQDDTQREAAEWAARMEADFRAHQPNPFHDPIGRALRPAGGAACIIDHVGNFPRHQG